MSKRIALGEYIEKSKIVHGDKYDYSLTHLDFKNCKDKVKIICPIHGIFKQSFSKHIYRRFGCPNCSPNKRKNTKQFVEDAKKIHGDSYDYSLVEYVNAKTKVKIICPKHGTFLQIPNSHLSGNGCRFCRGEKLSEKERIPQDKIINCLKKIHPEYDYSKVNYINAKTKIIVICPEHGEFKMIAGKLRNGQGCPKCGIIKVANVSRKTTEEFIRDAKKVHGNRYDYSLAEYKSKNTKVKIICPKHGMFEQSACAHIKGQNCPRCNLSHGEEKILRWLNNNGYIINKDYFTQKKFKELGKRSYDFYIPSKNLLIEYNGKQHYMISLYNGSLKKLKEQRHSDWIKRKFAKDKGINLLTIKYTDFNNLENILENKIGTLK